MFIVVTLNFFLPRMMPGDPIQGLVSSAQTSGVAGAAATTREQVADYYGLDRPLGQQYLRYIGGLPQGELGTSIRYRSSVSGLVAERLPWTLLLGATALVLGLGGAVLAGIHAGWRSGRHFDIGLTTLFVSVRLIPPFFLASVLAFVFAVKLGWFPLSGAETAFSDPSLVGRLGDIAHHLVLPATVVALQIGTFQYLLTRASMVMEVGSDYLALGRAKGLGERWLKYRYAARNAAVPVVSHTAMMLGAVLSGSILVETIFAYPGMGRLTFEAIAARDYPVLQAAFLVFSLGVLTVNFLADLIYPRLDPRAT